MLDAYGKFPIFEDNWKSSDFNIIKAHTSSDNSLLQTSVKSKNLVITYIQMKIKELDEDLSDSFILELLRDEFNSQQIKWQVK